MTKMGEGAGGGRISSVRTFLPLVSKHLLTTRGETLREEMVERRAHRRTKKDAQIDREKEREREEGRGGEKKFLVLHFFFSTLFVALSVVGAERKSLCGKGVRMRRVWEICYFLPSLPPPTPPALQTPRFSSIYMRVPSRATGGERTRGESPFDLGTH